MPRPLLKKVVQQRIKFNKAVMKDEKKIVMDAMTAAAKGEDIDAPATRQALASFIKASKDLNVDTAKLKLAE